VAVVAAALAAAATASPPKQQLTAAGNARAKAVVLKLSDLPAGWKSSGSGGGSRVVTCKSFNPKQSDLTQIGRADLSFVSADGLVNLSSIAAVFRSSGQAQASWNRFVKPGLLTCLASFLESTAGKGTTVKIASKRPLSLSVPGRRHRAYRLIADVTASGDRAKVYLDLILQGAGPVDTVLLVTSVLTPPSAALERKLAAAIAARLPK
jgi:hypothetical protein